MKFRLAARCVFCFGPNADYFFGLSGCGMYHFILVPMSVCPPGEARFHFIATYLCGICLFVDLLKYDSYGRTSIINDWVGLRYL